MRTRFFGCFVMCLVCLSAFVSLAQQSSEVIAQAFRTVNVRQGPATLFPTVAQLQSGDIVSVIGRSNPENDWLFVQIGTEQGWIAYFTVTVSGDPNSLPIVEYTANTIEEDTAALQSVVTANETLPETLIDQPSVIAYRRVNVRLGPGTGFERIGTLTPNMTTAIIGRTEGNQWLQIEYNGQTGWVAYFVVTVRGDLEILPLIDPEIGTSGTPTPSA